MGHRFSLIIKGCTKLTCSPRRKNAKSSLTSISKATSAYVYLPCDCAYWHARLSHFNQSRSSTINFVVATHSRVEESRHYSRAAWRRICPLEQLALMKGIGITR